MRLNIGFRERLSLPIHYNILQAVILNWLGDENYQKFIHDFGYKIGKRKYKLFTFSKIYGKFKINRERKIMQEIKLILEDYLTLFKYFLSTFLFDVYLIFM